MSKIMEFKLAKATKRKQTFTNCIYMNENDMKLLNITNNDIICVEEVLTCRCRKDNDLKEGTLGTSLLHWETLKVEAKDAVGKIVKVEKWKDSIHNQKNFAKIICFVVDTWAKTKTRIEEEKLISYIYNTLGNEVFCVDEKLIICWQIYGKDYWISLRVVKINIDDNNNNSNEINDEKSDNNQINKLKEVRFCNITSDTIITILPAKNEYLELIWPEGKIRRPILFNNLDPQKLGIGGLGDEFNQIFRRAFASRLCPPDLIDDWDIKHVKGMLLYGPPGTGKTLIARNIGKMLSDNEPTVVNGPEILNKYVGQSEENIRKLFEPAIKEQKEKGNKSSLHIVIFDEIDAICKQRGMTNSSTGVQDTVVNQLLSMIDGVNSLNNVLIIAMTNRKDLIDKAVLRSGRLELHIEIGLPDEKGRHEIFRIHTRKLREGGYLDSSISLLEYAKKTKNYTGAEITEIIRSAMSFALKQNIDINNLNNININKLRNIKISKQYFDQALNEVKPEFGNNYNNNNNLISNNIIIFNENVNEIITFTNNVIKRLKNSSKINRQNILLCGDIGSGKTSLAYYLAKNTLFPFLRIISPKHFNGRSENDICQSINKIFNDAYKSNYSVIIIDDLKRLIKYSVGLRFSNNILQCILTAIRTQPEQFNRKILIILTSDIKIINQLQIFNEFDHIRELPLVNNQKEFKKILIESSQFKNKCKPSINDIINIFPKNNANITISNLLNILELSINDNNIITQQSFKITLQSKLLRYKKYNNNSSQYNF